MISIAQILLERQNEFDRGPLFFWEEFNFRNYDLINASWSLPFIHKNKFNSVFSKLKTSLKPDGIFVGQFLGEKDDWNVPSSGKSFLTRKALEKLFQDMEVVELIEENRDGFLATGETKHWHVFHIISRKP